MKKKLVIAMTIMCTTSIFIGCGNTTSNSTSSSSVSTSSSSTDSKNDKVIVTVDDIETVDLIVKEPDSIGNVYMECKFKNNSDYTLTNITYKYQVGDETVYLSTYDTLLTGDTSTVASTFGPESGNIDDAKLLKVEITALDDDNNNVFIEYDTKLNSYSVY